MMQKKTPIFINYCQPSVSSLLFRCLLSSTLFFCCVGLVQASPPDAGTLLRDQPVILEEIQRLPERETLPPPLPDTGTRIELQKVRFSGHEGVVSEDFLQALVAEFIGQELGFNGLMHLTEVVTEALREQGYLLAFAYLPEQDITDGELLITLQAGELENAGNWQQILDNNTTRLNNQRLAGTLNHQLRLEEESWVQSQRLERSLLLLNDLAGVSASSSLSRGSQPGTTRLDLDVYESPRYTGAIWADNYGNRYTGEARLNAMGQVNNLSGQGDRFTALLTQTRDMSYLNLGYQVPLGYSGLTGNANINYLRYELGKELKALDYEGDALSTTLGLSYPLIRSRLQNLYLNTGYEYKRLDDEQSDNNIRDRIYHNLFLSIVGDSRDNWSGGGINNYSLGLRAGTLNRKGNAVDYAQDQLGPQAQGSFTSLQLSGSRLQRVTDQLTFLAHLSGQYAFDNLDSSEQFSVGGPNGVRAYPAGELSGDHGWQASLEIRYDLAQLQSWNHTLQVNAFYDVGGVTLRRDRWEGYTPANTNETNTPVIMGAGFGANLGRPGVYSLRTSLAFKINDKIEDRSTAVTDSDGKSRDPRLWIQAIVWF